MLKKSLLIVVILFTLSHQVFADTTEESKSWLDFDLGACIGINGGFGYGYEALLEYRFSENTSLYIIGNLMKDMEARYSDNHDYDMKTGNSQMVGMQIRLWKYFTAGYHHVTKSEPTLDVIEKATNAYSWGFLSSGKEWEWGFIFYEFNDEARNGESSSSGGFFVRRKFFF